MFPDLNELRTCSGEQLTTAFQQLTGLERAVRAQRLAILAVVDERESWRPDGCSSTLEWVAVEDGDRRRTAAELVEVSRCLVELPAIADRFAAGELSWDQLRPLCRLATPETDEEWAERAVGMNPAMLERHARVAARTTPDEAEERQRRRRFTVRPTRDGVKLSGFLPDAEGSIVRAAIDRIAEQAGADEHGAYEPYDARCADALVELASASLADEASGGRTTVVVFVEADALVVDDGSAVTADGAPMTGETARRLSCDGYLQVVATDGSGEPIGVGRRSRTVPDWLYRLLVRRDHGCRFPGCGRTRLLHAHHLVHWAHEGRTDLENLVLQCSTHQRTLHEGGWGLTGDPSIPDGLTFTRPDGRVVGPVVLRPDLVDRLLERPPPRAAEPRLTPAVARRLTLARLVDLRPPTTTAPPGPPDPLEERRAS